MSFFGCTIETLEKVIPHPDAERLDLGYMKGLSFQLVLPKGIYKENEKIVYFPIDSVIPEPILVKIGLSGKLSGAQKNRVKIGKKIRGEWAEGLAQKFETLWEFISDKPLPKEIDEEIWNKQIPDAGKNTNGESIDTTVLTKMLGVMKYELPDDLVLGNPGGRLPNHLSKYDIESTDREVDDVLLLMKMPVVVMEKVEGQNFCATYDVANDRFYVCSRQLIVKEPSEIEIQSNSHSTFWKTCIKYKLKEKLIQKAKQLNCNYLSIYAEQCGPGIQNNIYGFDYHLLKFFDLKIDMEWASFDQAKDIFTELGLEGDMVPVLSYGKTLEEFLEGRSINDAATGNSVYKEILREGIVIKPVVEYKRNRGGRLILKKRSLEYLGGSNL